MKWLGAAVVFLICSYFGVSYANAYRKEQRNLRNLVSILDFMECELQYRSTPLPQLCRQAGLQCQGKIQQVFILLADELDAQVFPNVQRCMASVMDRIGHLERPIYDSFRQFGNNLGKFDLIGQVQGLNSTRQSCTERLEQLMQNRESRIRSYQTLGLCAGAAIAILFV